MNWDHSEVFAVFAIAGAGALWKAASLRGDLAKEWEPRASDAEAGLADRATGEAVGLQREITEMIGSGSGSIPRLATVDPGPLVTRAEDFRHTLVIGARVPRDLDRLLRIGPLAVAAVTIFLAGLAALFLHSSELLSGQALLVAAVVLIIGAVAFALLLAIAYFILNQRLSAAEIRSRKEPA